MVGLACAESAACGARQNMPVHTNVIVSGKQRIRIGLTETALETKKVCLCSCDASFGAKTPLLSVLGLYKTPKQSIDHVDRRASCLQMPRISIKYPANNTTEFNLVCCSRPNAACANDHLSSA